MKYTDEANTAVGSTAAVVGAVAAVSAASLGPVLASILALGGMSVATAALIYKLNHPRCRRDKSVL